MSTRAVHAPTGSMGCAEAVRRDRPECGVKTFFKRRQSCRLITEMAAPVSTSAWVVTLSMMMSMTFMGERIGLGQFDDDAVLAPGTAAPSFPLRESGYADALATTSGVLEMASDRWRYHGNRQDWT